MMQQELFYTEPDDTQALRAARKAIAAWSLPRAAARIAAAKQQQAGGTEVLKVSRVGHAAAAALSFSGGSSSTQVIAAWSLL